MSATVVVAEQTGTPGLRREQHAARRWYVLRLSPLVIFLAIFFLTPFVILFLYSFGRSSIVSLSFGTNLENWSTVLTDEFYRRLLVRSIVTGAIVGVLSVVIAFPFAFAISLGPLRRHAEGFLFAVLVSLFSAYVVRIYAWRTLLGRNGIINETFGVAGLGPYDFLLFNQPAVILTLVNVLVPMAVLPIYSSLAQVDPALIEAARDAGAGSLRTLASVTIPLASRGINAAFALCFLIAAGDYVTPQFVGGIDGQMLGNVIAEQFGTAFNWPLGSALAFMLVGAMALVIGAWLLMMRLLGFPGIPVTRRGLGTRLYCAAVLIFLFAPTLTIVLFAFESSGKGTLPFEGWTLEWFREVLDDQVMVQAFRTSAVVGVTTAVVAVVIGTLAAYAMHRYRSRTGRLVVSTATLPLAFPYLVLGIALLSMFRVLDFRLSTSTIVVGHLLITLPVVIATVNARFATFDPAVEEAARDLGAPPWRTFTSITFPLIRPSVIGGGLLALALSLEEFIVTLFTTGGASTVPVVIWGQMRRGVSPTVNAISALLLAATVLLIVITRYLTGASVTGSRRTE